MPHSFVIWSMVDILIASSTGPRPRAPSPELAITMPFLWLASLIESGTESNGSRAADDRVVRENSEGDEECVHRSAETAVEARGAGKYLGKRAVKQKVYRKLLDVALLLLALFDNAQDVCRPETLS